MHPILSIFPSNNTEVTHEAQWYMYM